MIQGDETYVKVLSEKSKEVVSTTFLATTVFSQTLIAGKQVAILIFA